MWHGRRDSNPQPMVLETTTLPLSYARLRKPTGRSKLCRHLNIPDETPYQTMPEMLTHAEPVKKWCRWRDSNPHALRRTILSRLRLPVPPHRPGTGKVYQSGPADAGTSKTGAVRHLRRAILRRVRRTSGTLMLVRREVGQMFMARSSSGLGHLPLKEETTGSNPVRATKRQPAEVRLRQSQPVTPHHWTNRSTTQRRVVVREVLQYPARVR